MSVLGVLVVACFVALFARLWYLQVIEAPRLVGEVSAQTRRTVAVEAPRGRILDAKGRVLVDNRTSLVVTVDRNVLSRIKDRSAYASSIAAVLTRFGNPTKTSTVERRLAAQQGDRLRAVSVATDVSQEVMVYLSEHSSDFPGLSVSRESLRVYPYGMAAANVLGYVGRITADGLRTLVPGEDPDSGEPKVYSPDSSVGLAGIEATYEKDLRGTPGVETIEVDSKNRPVRRVDYTPPRPGSDVQLHLDIDVQMRAEQSLREKLDVLRGTAQRDGTVRRAPAGSVVVMDPKDGSVIALATHPTYDPAEFAGGISQDRYNELLDQNGVSALVDRSISGQYAPGSTFKLVTATAALERGLINGNTYYDDEGSYEVGNPPQTFTNAGGVKNGSIALPTALTISSDVYFYWLGDRLDGTTAIQDAASDFGFDTRTGIDLPNESSGYVWTAAEKKALHQKYPKQYPDGEWFTGDNVQLAIGQYVITATPIQLARAYATFANGGTVYTPRVAWRVLRSNTLPTVEGGILRTIEPAIAAQRALPAEIRDPISQGLGAVTTGLGTAASAFVGFDQAAFRVVGKTGTAQVQGKADTSLFASYAPADNPRYAVAAVMEESGFGAEASGEVVRHVYELLAGQTLTGASTVVQGTRD
ncbi:MAG: penicillin-binding protein 2 [Acidobacteria bacterium]|nr:penicillin-binding protein 2 [Acidobacteriota bacterium]